MQWKSRLMLNVNANNIILTYYLCCDIIIIVNANIANRKDINHGKKVCIWDTFSNGVGDR